MKPCFVSPILKKIAGQLGIKIQIEPKYGYVGQIVLADGRKRYFRNTNFDLNPLGASEIARDKAYAAYFMKQMGYPVPEGEEFFTERWCEVINSSQNPEAAYRYACSLGLPVIIKPNSKSQGTGVCKVYNKREFKQAVRGLSATERVFLVQKVAAGNDYRIVVLDNEIISAYQRLPLSVVGNGSSTIKKILLQKQEMFQKGGRDTIIPIDDFRINNQLKRMGFSRETILQNSQKIALLPNANLSTGGEAIDVSKEMSLQWKKFAIQLTKDMGLRYCGVDLMVEGTLSEPPGSFAVLEVNAAPGLDHYAAVGKKQKRIVEAMYRKVFEAMLWQF